MSSTFKFDRRNPIHRFLFGALVIGHAVGAIALTLGAGYAWLWFVVLAVKVLGIAIGSVVLVVSLTALVWLLHLYREPMFCWYQPWDHSFWIAVERQTSHSWQSSVDHASSLVLPIPAQAGAVDRR